ncbi:hypothetical protein GJ496_005866 [Pomphorhynchus laevis]|nr:hypothetical protein GJ496_005866 [Pomphorhynchus laevis]
MNTIREVHNTESNYQFNQNNHQQHDPPSTQLTFNNRYPPVQTEYVPTQIEYPNVIPHQLLLPLNTASMTLNAPENQLFQEQQNQHPIQQQPSTNSSFTSLHQQASSIQLQSLMLQQQQYYVMTLLANAGLLNQNPQQAQFFTPHQQQQISNRPLFFGNGNMYTQQNPQSLLLTGFTQPTSNVLDENISKSLVDKMQAISLKSYQQNSTLNDSNSQLLQINGNHIATALTNKQSSPITPILHNNALNWIVHPQWIHMGLSVQSPSRFNLVQPSPPLWPPYPRANNVLINNMSHSRQNSQTTMQFSSNTSRQFNGGLIPASSTDDKSESTVLMKLKCENNFNPKEFDMKKLNNARFFIIKSYSEDDIHRSIKYGIWCSTPSGNRRLNDAFREREEKGTVYLFFSVNESSHFCGIAEMMSPVDYDFKSAVWVQDKWKGKMDVKWIYVKDVPNTKLRHIQLENNFNKPVTFSRDSQEVPLEKAKQVFQIIHTYKEECSLLDDFDHYEIRQREQHKLRRNFQKARNVDASRRIHRPYDYVDNNARSYVSVPTMLRNSKETFK